MPHRRLTLALAAAVFAASSSLAMLQSARPAAADQDDHWRRHTYQQRHDRDDRWRQDRADRRHGTNYGYVNPGYYNQVYYNQPYYNQPNYNPYVQYQPYSAYWNNGNRHTWNRNNSWARGRVDRDDRKWRRHHRHDP
jgi:Ni/Co efflux regulator RcnB